VFLIDIAEEEGNLEKARQLCTALSNGVDDIHKKYWIHRASTLQAK